MFGRIASLSIGLGVIPVLIYIGMTAAFRMDAISLMTLFSVMRTWLGTAIFGGTVVLVIGAVLSVVTRKFGWAVLGLMGALVSGSVVYSLSEMKRIGAEVPAIHDITTDTSDPPEFEVTAKERSEDENPAAYDTAQTAAQLEAYTDLKPIVVATTLEVAFEAAEAALKDAGVAIKDKDPETGRLEGTATSAWFGFKDDVVIRIRATSENEVTIDIRSKSRIGKSDLGANAERIRQIRDGILQRVNAVG